jgi:hypothetical protein
LPGHFAFAFAVACSLSPPKKTPAILTLNGAEGEEPPHLFLPLLLQLPLGRLSKKLKGSSLKPLPSIKTR